MLAYAAPSRRVAGRAGSPKALTLIVVGHAVLIAAVMTAKMDVVGPMIDIKLIALQIAVFGRAFAMRFAPLVFAVALISSVVVGRIVL